MEWVSYNVRFDFDQVKPELIHYPWTGHRFFAYDLIRFMKPRLIVELGTYYGHSFFSFCQAVHESGIDCTCCAIDTWQGDPQSGSYGEEVFRTFSGFVTRYPNASFIRDTFDKALDSFRNESIDILHIDGLHTLEAVRHDYEAWLPKLAENGIVLFHDITVYGNGFGVYQLWDELKARHPHMEFRHSYGLGVLFPKGCLPIFTKLLTDSDEIRSIYEKKAQSLGESF